MFMNRRRNAITGVGSIVLSTLAAAAIPAAAQVSGAIYTTTSTGMTVNGNLYPTKADVYLNGGPPPNAPCTSAGLPDGEYYFQVTNPSGSVLLSSDGIAARNAGVSGGLITSLGSTGTHAVGTGKCPGAISIQLIPFDNTPNPGGEYKAWMTKVSDYDPIGCASTFGFCPAKSKTDNFKVREGECVGPGCVAPSLPAITGVKYYDLDTDGINDGPGAGEVTIPGFRIDVAWNDGVSSGTTTTFTDSSGVWALVFPTGTTFTACEVLPVGTWVQTGPIVGATSGGATANASRCWTGTVGSGDTTGLDFGNVCLGPGGGRTLGFWSNKNGQALFGADDLALMVSLNLRNADGSHFNPGNYSSFRNWLLNASATNMAYMLSAQLAAMELNVLNGFVNGSSLVFAGASPSGCSVPVNQAGFISVNSLMSDANTELGSNGLTLAGNPERVCQEFKKNALDRANNNLNFVQPTPCPVVY